MPVTAAASIRRRRRRRRPPQTAPGHPDLIQGHAGRPRLGISRKVITPGSREFLDEQDNVLPPVTLKTAELDEFADWIYNEAPFYRASDGNASAPREVQETFVSKQTQHTAQHRVLVHTENSRQVLGEGKAISWGRLTLSDRPSDLGSHLIVESNPILPVNADLQHRATDSSLITADVQALRHTKAPSPKCRSATPRHGDLGYRKSPTPASGNPFRSIGDRIAPNFQDSGS